MVQDTAEAWHGDYRVDDKGVRHGGTIRIHENMSNEEAAISLIHEYTHSLGGGESDAWRAHISAAAEIYKGAGSFEIPTKYDAFLDSSGKMNPQAIDTYLNRARSTSGSVYERGWINRNIKPAWESRIW